MNNFFKIFIITLIFLFSNNPKGLSENEKIKIGLLVPLTGDNKNLGNQIIKSTKMALKEIGTNKIEIYPKDTESNANIALQSANALKKMGVKIIIGPIFYDELTYLNEIENVIFLSLQIKLQIFQKMSSVVV